eukprot:TRINITY_DN23006_c0_g1_i2.p1 TRINITY_DN23006_c0_g1~~TRINITY_DN23006_c0_g1_i2.p1  ORF type:complete len:692 (-),score=211.28 TRINITY_DN23006_c0_g1_i2:74-2149(-)
MVQDAKCPYCGNVYLADSIFCRHCGKKREVGRSSSPSISRGLGFAALPGSEAQHNVDFLCNRFSILFAQLAREEAGLKSASLQNDTLEKQLLELKRAEEQDVANKVAFGNRFDSEAAGLKAEAQAAEHRAAQDSGEASALWAAQATYERQSERLHQRCQAELERERSATDALRHRASEVRELQCRQSELHAQLEAAEAARGRLNEELRQAGEGGQRAIGRSRELQAKLQEEKVKTQDAEEQAKRGREDVDAVEQRIVAAKRELQDLQQQLAEERDEVRSYESRLQEQVGRKTRLEEELAGLTVQLEQRRREGSELQVQYEERVRETWHLRERLHAEQRRRESELQAADAAAIQLKRFEVELAGAEKAKADVESELADLRQRAADLEQRCFSQRQWREEQRQKQNSSEAALERLREELRVLTAERTRLQKEADQTTHERTRLEVELQVAAPALEEVWRRCQGLEEKLSMRVRELSDESDRIRRLQNETDAAKARLQAAERHTESLGRKLRQYQAAPKMTRHAEPQAEDAVDLDHARKIQDRQTTAADGATTCPHCGSIFMADSLFCRRCGQKRLTSSSAPEARLREPSRDISSPRRHGSMNCRLDEAAGYEGVEPVAAPHLPGRKSAGAGGGSDTGRDADAVKFLCEFIAREEARLGSVTPRQFMSSASTPSLATPVRTRPMGGTSAAKGMS